MEKQPRVTRRAFLEKLRDIATGVGASTIFPDAVFAAPGYEHRPVEPADEEYFQRLLTDPAALTDFRERPTLEQIERVIRVLARTRTGWANTLREQGDELHAGAEMLFDEERQHVGNGTVVRVRHNGRTRRVLVTATHVAQSVPAASGSHWVRHPSGRYDISVRELSTDEIAARRRNRTRSLPFFMNGLHASADISGEIGAVIGFDSDQGSRERKVFPSRISPRATNKYFRVLDVDTRELIQTEDFRLIVLPPMESLFVSYGGRAAQGMSGGAWVYRPRDAHGEMRRGVGLGGVLLSVNWRTIGNTHYVVGHIADHTQVRETIAHLLGPEESEEPDWRRRVFGQN